MAARQPVYDVFPPRVESLETLDLLLAELCRIDALEKRVQAETAEKVAAITQAATQRLLIEVGDGDPLPLADWRTQLEAAAEKFANRHREEILEEGKQSRELNHGTFGWRRQKAALVPLDDFPAGGNPKLLEGLLKPLRAALEKLIEFAASGARFVDLKLAWRKTEILKAYKDGQLAAATIKKMGFEPQDPWDKFFIEVKSGDLESQSSEKP